MMKPHAFSALFKNLEGVPDPSTTLQSLIGQMDIYLIDQIQKGRFDAVRTVLDAGCGGGRNLTFFLQNGQEVYGIDQDPRAIDRVRHLAQSLNPGTPGGRFLVATLEDLPFETARFDAVLCSAVLHFATDEQHFAQMLDEMWRVLHPGGLFFARLASSIGIEHLIQPVAGRRYHLPDGTERFLVDEPFLLHHTERLHATLLDPIKTTNVQNLRCMTTWCLRK